MAAGAGGVIASLLVPKISRFITKPRTAIFLFNLALAILFILYAYCRSLLSAGVIVGLIGISGIFGLILMVSTLQKEVPETLRGRVFSLSQNLFFSAMYIASGVAGVVGDRLGIEFGLILGGVLMIAILISPFAFRWRMSTK